MTVNDALQLAVLHHQADRLPEAEDIYQQVLRARPNNPDVLRLLGLLQQTIGKIDLAENLLRQSLSHQPDQPEVWSHLGNMLQEQNKFGEAEKCCREAIRIDPSHAAAYNNLGNALKLQNKINQAITAYKSAIKIKPDYAAAHYNLGNILREQGELDEAITSYQLAIEIKPDHAAAHNNLGDALKAQAKLEEAIASYHRAIEVKLDYADPHNNLGNVLREQGKLNEAIASYQRAIKINPHYADPHNNLGNVLREQGKLNEAIASYQQAIEIKPDYAVAHHNLASTKKCQEHDGRMQAMAGLLHNSNLPDNERLHLCFALGKAYEDLKIYKKSFPYIEQGNRLKRKMLRYDIQQTRDLFHKIKTSFGRDLLEQFSGSGIQDPTPVFILGMPRSGTTLVEQILASHPDVHGAGELGYLKQLMVGESHRISQVHDPNTAASLSADQLAKIGQSYIEQIRPHSPTARFITDKMPGNFQYIGMIKLILPLAKVIHCRRNPMDNCLSIYKTYFAGDQPFAYDQRELAQYYLLYQDLLAHWHEMLPGFIFEIQYEDLVSDQETHSRRLLDFCGLEWDAACLEFHKADRPVRTASDMQVRQPMYKTSVEAWKNYEEYLQPMLEVLQEPVRLKNR